MKIKIFHSIFLSLFHNAYTFNLSPPISNTPPIFQHKQHIVCESIIPINKYPEVLTVSRLYAPSLTEDINYMQLPSIEVMDEIVDKNEQIISLKKEQSKFQELRYETMYKNRMSYERYCYLEAKLGMISRAYVMDQVRHWCLFMDSSSLYHDGVMGYWPKSVFKNVMMITSAQTLGYPDLVLWWGGEAPPLPPHVSHVSHVSS